MMRWAERGPGFLLVVRLGRAAALAAPRPPVVARGLAVERARAGDRHIPLLVRVHEGRVVHAFHALESRKDDWVVLRVGAESHRRILHDVEVHVALQVDRSREKHALRHDHASAARPSGLVDSAAEGLG